MPDRVAGVSHFCLHTNLSVRDKGRNIAVALNEFLLIVVIMGVTGAGKTTIGKLLAQRLRWDFVDADSFHSPENIEKIRLGIPLDDADRAAWLKAIRQAMDQWIAKKQDVVLACSALKKAYREELDAGADLEVVYLKGTYDVIHRRR